MGQWSNACSTVSGEFAGAPLVLSHRTLKWGTWLSALHFGRNPESKEPLARNTRPIAYCTYLLPRTGCSGHKPNLGPSPHRPIFASWLLFVRFFFNTLYSGGKNKTGRP